MRISNKTLFSVHGWCGLNLGFLLFVICFSGTIATLSSEIDWLLDSDVRTSEPGTKVSPILLSEAYQRVQYDYPDANIYAIRETPEDYLATRFYLNDRDKGNITVYLDPYSGAVLAERDRLSIKNFFRIFHKQLFIVDTKFTVNGVLIVGLFGFSLLLTLLSGIFFMGGWLKKLLRLRWDKGLRVFFTDWHRSTGLWTMVFSMLFALTGMWYWIEKVASISESSIVEQSEVRYQDMAPVLSAPDFAMYIRKAKTALPGLEVNAFFLPSEPGEAVHVFGQTDAILVRDAANYVALNPYNGDVLAVRNATDLGVLDRWLHTVDPLHFGTFGGLWTKALWFFFGLLLTISIPVGMYLWYKRVYAGKAKDGAGIGRIGIAVNVLSVSVLVLSMLFSSMGMLRMQAGADATHKLRFANQQVGPWGLALQHKINAETGDVGRFELLFDQVRPNIKSAQLQIEKADGSKAIKSTFKLKWRSQQARVPMTNLVLEDSVLKDSALAQALGEWYAKVASISVQLEDHQGRRHQYYLTRDEILRSLPELSNLGAPVKSHTPVQVFIISFLVLIWLLLIVWGTCYYRVYRQYVKGVKQPAPSSLDIDLLGEEGAVV